MNHGYLFANRAEAGRMLADELARRHYENPVVLALPRGGVPVAAEVARTLEAPLDLVLVRKIGVPWQPELALAAVVDGEHPEVVINEDVWRHAGVSEPEFERLKTRALRELEHRRLTYLQGRARSPVKGRTAIVVDDGIATGATARAALLGLRRGGPKRLVLAVPVAPPDTIERLSREVDELVCLETPSHFHAIGGFYRAFDQTGDDEVIALLARYGAHGPDQAE